MPVCQVTVVPLGTGTPSLSSYVAGCQKILDGCPTPVSYTHLTLPTN